MGNSFGRARQEFYQASQESTQPQPSPGTQQENDLHYDWTTRDYDPFLKPFDSNNVPTCCHCCKCHCNCHSTNKQVTTKTTSPLVGIEPLAPRNDNNETSNTVQAYDKSITTLKQENLNDKSLKEKTKEILTNDKAKKNSNISSVSTNNSSQKRLSGIPMSLKRLSSGSQIGENQQEALENRRQIIDIANGAMPENVVVAKKVDAVSEAYANKRATNIRQIAEKRQQA